MKAAIDLSASAIKALDAKTSSQAVAYLCLAPAIMAGAPFHKRER